MPSVSLPSGVRAELLQRFADSVAGAEAAAFVFIYGNVTPPSPDALPTGVHLALLQFGTYPQFQPAAGATSVTHNNFIGNNVLQNGTATYFRIAYQSGTTTNKLQGTIGVTGDPLANVTFPTTAWQTGAFVNFDSLTLTIPAQCG